MQNIHDHGTSICDLILAHLYLIIWRVGCVILQVNHYYTAVVVGPYISDANVTVDEVKQRESLPQSEFYNNQALLAITTL